MTLFIRRVGAESWRDGLARLAIRREDAESIASARVSHESAVAALVKLRETDTSPGRAHLNRVKETSSEVESLRRNAVESSPAIWLYELLCRHGVEPREAASEVAFRLDLSPIEDFDYVETRWIRCEWMWSTWTVGGAFWRSTSRDRAVGDLVLNKLTFTLLCLHVVVEWPSRRPLTEREERAQRAGMKV